MRLSSEAVSCVQRSAVGATAEQLVDLLQAQSVNVHGLLQFKSVHVERCNSAAIAAKR